MEVFYPHPPERVWKALTDRRALSTWMMDNNFEACLGHKFWFQSCPLPGQEITIYCEVLEVEAPKRLIYSWKEQPTSEPSRVTWTLTAVEGGTQVHLRHRCVAMTAIPVFGIPVLDRSSRMTSDAQLAPSSLESRSLAAKTWSEKKDSDRNLEFLNRQANWHYWLEQRLTEMLTRSHL